MAKIKVLDSNITVVKIKNEDYISLTDIAKSKDGNFLYLIGLEIGIP